MAQPCLLTHLDVIVDRERQGRRLTEHLDLIGDDLDLAAGEIRVRVALGAHGNLAGDLDAVLVAQGVGDLFAYDDLDDAAGFAQIQEGHSPVVATTSHPTREGDTLADVFGA